LTIRDSPFALLQLSGFYARREQLIAAFGIERYADGKMLEGILLHDRQATLKLSPYVSGKQLLTVHLKLPQAKLYRGKMKGHTMLAATEM